MDFVDSRSSESTDFQIRKIRATKKKGGNKITLQEDNSSEDEEYIPKKYKINNLNENKRVTRSMNNNKNTPDTTKKMHS